MRCKEMSILKEHLFEILRTTRRALRLAIFVILIAQCSICVYAQNSLRMEVTSIPDPTHAFPGTRLYKGMIKNVGKSQVTLEAVQMPREKPGGFTGGGRFFRCSIQTWDAQVGGWHTVHSPKLADFGAHQEPVHVNLDAGEELEVCRWLLPTQGGHIGDRARFALHLTWASPAASVASTPFTIGEDIGADQEPSSSLRHSGTQLNLSIATTRSAAATMR